MGTYRLILAYMVMFSHAGFSIFGRNQGVVAVISFLLLSGYVMTALIDKHYTGKSNLPGFYIDRVMRLMPQYLLYSAITLILGATAIITPPSLSNPSLAGLLYNISLIPTNIPYFLDFRFIPPAWSLGLEAQFYLIFPILLILRARTLAVAISLGIFMFAYSGILSTDAYGYRLLPGTLFIFLIGSLMRSGGPINTKIVIGIYSLAVALFAFLQLKPELKVPFNVEVIVGILIGVPLVAVLVRLKFGAIDTFLGNISYGAFLNHQMFIWIFTQYGMDMNKASSLFILATASTILAAITYYLVERPVINARHKIRAKKESAKAATEQIAI